MNSLILDWVLLKSPTALASRKRVYRSSGFNERQEKDKHQVPIEVPLYNSALLSMNEGEEQNQCSISRSNYFHKRWTSVDKTKGWKLEDLDGISTSLGRGPTVVHVSQ